MTSRPDEPVVAVTCVGSGVGRAVVTSLRLGRWSGRVVGVGTEEHFYGRGDLDVARMVPPVDDDSYIDDLLEICRDEGVSVVVPGLDIDVQKLSTHRQRFEAMGVHVVLSSHEVVERCRFKDKVAQESECSRLFAKTMTNQEAKASIESGTLSFPLIAKPRSGAGSKGVRVVSTLAELENLEDDFVVQEVVSPELRSAHGTAFEYHLKRGVLLQVEEVSVQLLFDVQSSLMGKMATLNRLKMGVPVDIVPFEDEGLWERLEPLINEFSRLGARGPINLQGRKVQDGFKIFEVNPRFTGITSARARLGFNEVCAYLRRYLGIPPVPLLVPRLGRRVVRQVDEQVYEAPSVCVSPSTISSRVARKNVLVLTGASGNLGRTLLRHIAGDREVWIITGGGFSSSMAQDLQVAKVFHFEDVDQGNVPLGAADRIVHAGFSLIGASSGALAQSMERTARLFRLAFQHQVPGVIFISSHKVYGQLPGPWTESTPRAPDSPYGVAKHAGELLLDALHGGGSTTRGVGLRLGTLSGGTDGHHRQELLAHFARQALSGQPLTVHCASDVIRRLDYDDAASAILRLVNQPVGDWEPWYNVEASEGHSLVDVSSMVAAEVSKVTRRPPVPVLVGQQVSSERGFMSNEQAVTRLDWEPCVPMAEVVHRLVRQVSESVTTPGAS